jgi:DnaK suppressor protein
MDTYDPSMSARFRELLIARARELGELLHHEADGAGEDPTREVGDYKDAAGQEAIAAVDAAHAAHAGRELEQIRAALKRIADDTYGQCLDCGEPIDLRRLLALPATPFCTACQSAHEHGGERR